MNITLDHLREIAFSHVAGQETATPIAGLTLWSSPCLTQATPALFEPSVYLVLQGAKRMLIGSDTVEFSAGSLSVSAIGLPFTGQVIAASPGQPYIALRLALNAGLVASLLLDTTENDGIGMAGMPAATVFQVCDEIIEPLYRLLRLLSSPRDIPVLAPLIERELYYRLLASAAGNHLRQTVQAHTRFAQIKKAVEWICGNATVPMSVEVLAASVAMSLTSFHRHFKAVTGLSPLAYQRHVRLLYAQRLLNVELNSVTAVAFQVGYTSSSQFSREYTRMFGCPPVRDTFRSRLAAQASPSRPAQT